jgi:hypothetical protein
MIPPCWLTKATSQSWKRSLERWLKLSKHGDDSGDWYSNIIKCIKIFVYQLNEINEASEFMF